MSGMKSSTVKKLIRRKMKAWLDTLPEHLREDTRNGVLVTGGCISSMLMGEPINDYDVYFKNIDIAYRVAEHYIDMFNRTKGTLAAKAFSSCNPTLRKETRTNIKGEEELRIIMYMKSAGVAGEQQEEYQYFETRPEDEADDFVDSLQLEDMEKLAQDMIAKPLYRPVFFSENAITLSHQVQLITRFYGNAVDIHENFDFAHAMCSYDLERDVLVLPHDALTSMLSKSLIYNGSLYPLASMFRTRKFIERGFRITAGQMLKIAHQISEIDLNNRDVLREQLIGVDMMYMEQLLFALQKHKGPIDSTYLAKLIDQIFE